MEDGVTLEAGASKQTQLDWQTDGIKYCPGMGNVLLPSYFPVKYKPGYRGSRDQAEQLQLSQLQNPVCLTCKDGPRFEVTNLTKTGLELPDGSPCANSTRIKHPEIQVTVLSVQLYSLETACSAHPEGGEVSKKYEESFDTNITNLIEKWEELGGGGRRVEEEDY